MNRREGGEYGWLRPDKNRPWFPETSGHQQRQRTERRPQESLLQELEERTIRLAQELADLQREPIRVNGKTASPESQNQN